MQDQAQRVKPQALGILGRDHLSQILQMHHQVDPHTIAYKKVVAEASGVPCVLESVFGVYGPDHEDDAGQVITGINWSATLTPPFHLGEGISQPRVRHGDPSSLVHSAILRPTFRDRGSSHCVASPDRGGPGPTVA